jgi:nitroreductase
VYTFLNRREENELKEILHASQGDRIACMIQLGYRKIEPISPSRKEIKEIVSFEHL